ncbi:hypothetical protein HG535_0E02900 [Zygotorulaspora mrakii]|uniref:non-specific serine/threonine protein kinase n=1 Tax=Zygotorulaspora mrakii TaxID=42260 RepID=A0A7H9B4A7_ZYGMR|nr:uncharacterized protein HG535_0E02900 [Zygotorulaspora mrakii]QLG73206.1 hypothetical protein HG535_0E02900 [Zygotorulaspora mrakii]
MPYIGASAISQSSFKSLKEQHFAKGASPSRNSSKQSSICEESDAESIRSNTPDTTADTSSNDTGYDIPLEQGVRTEAKRTQSVSPTVSCRSECETNEVSALPNESTHAYSYNPLSPNSLAVRLSILKRSLEILIRNPNMLGDSKYESNSFNTDKEQCEMKKKNRKNNNANVMQQKFSAHSAALNAFVSSTTASANASSTSSGTASGIQSPGAAVSRTASSIIPFKGVGANATTHLHRPSSLAYISHNSKNERKGEIYYNRINASSSMDVINSQRADLEGLLELLNKTLENNTSERATDLHMISLLNIDKLILGKTESNGRRSSQAQLKVLQLKKTLLDSLAEPFFEHFNSQEGQGAEEMKELNHEIDTIPGLKLDANKVAMSSIRPQQDYGRILHTFTSGKNIAPQAIFTCTQLHPWQFKAANDLACLTFGISKVALKALTLLDLIHTDSRNFVLNKLLSTEGQELVFTGEIVAIVQPGSNTTNSNLIWASFWAKRKNDLLVCIFQKVPCDYVDVLLNLQDYSVDNISGASGLFWRDLKRKDVQSTDSPKFQIGTETDSDSDLEERFSNSLTLTEMKKSKSTNDISSKKKSVKFADEIHDIKELSQSLGQLIEDIIAGKVLSVDDDLLPVPIRVANHINFVRYFTLNDASNNIPCAVSCSILENELKLKIHSLPYQAGLFVLDSHTFQLISCNKSVLKNMFGHHFSELAGKDISEIIPSFKTLSDYVNASYPALNITLHRNIGLVLTEHFFRKIQAEMTDEVEDFYTSIGINALHRDGRIIKIDFQLRVMSSSVILLWVTHSRDVVLRDYSSTPSQLHMLKENDLAYVSSGNSSETSSKRSSSKISIDRLKDLASTGIETSTSADFMKRNMTSSSSSSTLDWNLSPVEKVKQKEEAKKTQEETGEKEEEEEEEPPSIQVGDPELQRKLDLARIYTRNKSEFVKEGNFKLDEELIKSITSTPQGTDSNLSLNKMVSDGQTSPSENKNSSRTEDSEPVPLFLTTPEANIGAQKHIKKFSDFLILQKMGEGAYGKVNLCLHRREKYIVVIKMIFKERILVDTWVRDRKLGTIPSEIQIMAALNKNPDENILRLLDFFEDDDYYYIETPVHGETGCIDLFDLIELKTNITELEVKLIFKQVVSSVKHLHDQGIVHRDIKDENVIVDSKGFVKLIDFGSAAYVKSGPFDVFVGTIDYAAPEVLGGEPYEGKPQDIWAIGVLLYTIVFKENPFYNIDEILEGTPKFDSNIDESEECIDLIKRILNKCPPKRPSIDEIYNDKWLQF